MLEKIKLMLGISDASKDELLMSLIESAIQEAKTITHNDSIAEHENVICGMVVYNYNRLGTEGVNKENYSGVSFDYSTDYPDNIVRQLKAFRKVVTLD